MTDAPSDREKLASATHRAVLGLLVVAVGIAGVAMQSSSDPLVGTVGLALSVVAAGVLGLLFWNGLREGLDGD